MADLREIKTKAGQASETLARSLDFKSKLEIHDGLDAEFRFDSEGVLKNKNTMKSLESCVTTIKSSGHIEGEA